MGTMTQINFREYLAEMAKGRGISLTTANSSSSGSRVTRADFRPKLDNASLEAHGILRRYQGVTFEAIKAKGVPPQIAGQYKAALDYADNLRQNIDRGNGLIMLGTPGLMKTTLAVAILRRLLETDIRGSGYIMPMVSMIDQLNTMRTMDRVEAAEYERRLRRCDLLILDDLGGEETSKWVMGKVDSIITERYNRMRPLIVTSNLDSDGLMKIYGGRIVDRLRGTCKIIKFSGASLR